jgi:hypothetical protein
MTAGQRQRGVRAQSGTSQLPRARTVMCTGAPDGAWPAPLPIPAGNVTGNGVVGFAGPGKAVEGQIGESVSQTSLVGFVALPLGRWSTY